MPAPSTASGAPSTAIRTPSMPSTWPSVHTSWADSSCSCSGDASATAWLSWTSATPSGCNGTDTSTSASRGTAAVAWSPSHRVGPASSPWTSRVASWSPTGRKTGSATSALPDRSGKNRSNER